MTHPYTRLFAKLAAPTINDDVSLGYEVGDIWLTASSAFQCLDATDGAAIWLDIGNSGLSFNDAEGNATDVHNTTAADGTSVYAARRDHTHRFRVQDVTEDTSTPSTTDSIFYADYNSVGGANRRKPWSAWLVDLQDRFSDISHNHTSDYAPISKGVTGGDSHDHNGGDGAQISHFNLSNIGFYAHASIDEHLDTLHVPMSHDHEGGDGGNLAFYLPFAAYTSISPITVGGGAPYAATVPASMSFLKWSQSLFTLGAAHNSSNYYTMTLKLRQGAPAADVTIATLDTQTLGSSTQLTLSTTSFTTGSVTGTGYIYMLMGKTGSPADLYVISPAFKCRLT